MKVRKKMAQDVVKEYYITLMDYVIRVSSKIILGMEWES
jgi:hypothetical protein